jgi:hypothetical protein
LKKQNLLNILILVTAVLASTVKAFATGEAIQTLTVSVPPSVAVEKSVSLQVGEIDPETGSHSGLNASFNLQTNGTDDDYIFIVGSKIISSDNVEVPAFTNDGQGLLFGRVGEEEFLPTEAAIQDARNGGSNNANIIVYPISEMSITSPMTVEFVNGLNVEGDSINCYQVKLNDGKEATLKQTIGGTPVPGSYKAGQDKAGSYKAVVYLTAISK